MPLSIHEQLIPKVVERLKALADESRIRLLLRLRQGPCNVSTLSAELGIGQASVSKHLGLMRQAGLVEVDRQGNQAIYRVHDASIFDLCEIVCDGVRRHVQEAHEALQPPTTPGRRRSSTAAAAPTRTRKAGRR